MQPPWVAKTIASVLKFFAAIVTAATIAAGGYLFSQARQVERNTKDIAALREKMNDGLAALLDGQKDQRAAIDKLTERLNKYIESELEDGRRARRR